MSWKRTGRTANTRVTRSLNQNYRKKTEIAIETATTTTAANKNEKKEIRIFILFMIKKKEDDQPNE